MSRSSARTWAAEQRIGPRRSSVDDGAAAVDVVPVRHGTRRDTILAGVAVAALGLTLLKPWASPIDSAPLADTLPPELSGQDVATASPRAVDAPIVIPAGAFDPPADRCLVDGRWRVCVFGASAHRQGIRNWLFSPLPPTEASRAPIEPVILLLTGEGAGLGFYPRVADSEVVAGHVAASAWWVPPGKDLSDWVPLRLVEPIRVIGTFAGTAYVPVTEGFVSAETWPPGRYAVLLAAGGSWLRYFTFKVVGTGASSCCYGTWRNGK